MIQVEQPKGASPAGTSTLERFLIFLAHQLVSTWGVIYLAVYLSYSTVDLFHLIGRPIPAYLHVIWVYRPYFPVQVALSIYSGWLIGRRWWQRSMLWVWVSPFCWYNVGFNNCADFTVAGLFVGNALSQQQVNSLSMGFRPNSLFNELTPFQNDEFDLMQIQQQKACVTIQGPNGPETQCTYD